MIKRALIVIFFSWCIGAGIHANEDLIKLRNTILQREGLGLRLQVLNAQKESIPNWYRPTLELEAGAGTALSLKQQQFGPIARLHALWTLYDGGLNSTRSSRLDAEKQVYSYVQNFTLVHRSTQIFAMSIDLTDTQENLQHYQASLEELGRLTEISRGLFRLGRAPSSMKQQLEIFNMEIQVLIEEASLKKQELTTRLMTQLGYIPEVQLSGGEQKVAFGLNKALLAVKTWQGLVAEEIDAEVYRWDIYSGFHAGYGPRLDALDPLQPEVGIEFGVRFPIITSVDRKAKQKAMQLSFLERQIEIELYLRNFATELSLQEPRAASLRKNISQRENMLLQLEEAIEKGIKDITLGRAMPDFIMQLIQQKHETIVNLQQARKELHLLQAQVYWLVNSMESNND